MRNNTNLSTFALSMQGARQKQAMLVYAIVAAT